MKADLQRAALGAVAALTASMFFTACNLNFKQDPLAGTPPEYKDDLEPISTKPTPSPTPFEMEYQLDHKNFFVFSEEVAGEEFISGRILSKINGEIPVLGKNYHVKIQNLIEFPGALFDEQSGRFSWTPPLGSSGGDKVSILSLTVFLETASGHRVGHPRAIPIHIHGRQAEPKVVSVDRLDILPIREGESKAFKVVVRDLDSKTGEEPKLIAVHAPTSLVNISSMVRIEPFPLVSLTDPTLWTFTAVLDTGNAELTSKTENHRFLLMALSRYGRPSEPRQVDVSFITKMAKADTNWKNRETFVGGRFNRYDFFVFDPKFEGKVWVTFTECPVGAQCRCERPVENSPVPCLISWNVPMTERNGVRRVLFKAENVSSIAGEPSTMEEFKREIFLSIPTPTPTPGPTPTPWPTPTPAPGATPTPVPLPRPSPMP